MIGIIWLNKHLRRLATHESWPWKITDEIEKQLEEDGMIEAFTDENGEPRIRVTRDGREYLGILDIAQAMYDQNYRKRRRDERGNNSGDASEPDRY